MEKENGIIELKKLNKEQTIIFIESFSYTSIAKTFGVSESTARRVVSKKIVEFGIVVRKSKTEPTPLRYKSYLLEEDCASVSDNKKQIVTKGGMFVFKGNAPIYKQKNKLSETVKEYVNAMLNNNQPLKFTTEQL